MRRHDAELCRGLSGWIQAEKPCDLLIALHGMQRSLAVRQGRLRRSPCRSRRRGRAPHDPRSPDYRAKTSWMGPKAEADLVQIIEELKSRSKIGKTISAAGRWAAPRL